MKMKSKVEKSQKNKKEQGITLIALVVTIIILLILSGITINMLFSNEGIFKIAQDAANATNTAIQDEQTEMNTLLEMLNSISNSNNNETEEVSLANRDILWVGDMHMAGIENDDKGFSAYFLETEEVNSSYTTAYSMLITDKENQGVPSFKNVAEDIASSGRALDIIVLEVGITDCFVYDMGNLDGSFKKEIGTLETAETQDTVISDFVEELNIIKGSYPDTQLLYVQSYDSSEEALRNYIWKNTLKYNSYITLEVLQQHYRKFIFNSR